MELLLEINDSFSEIIFNERFTRDGLCVGGISSRRVRFTHDLTTPFGHMCRGYVDHNAGIVHGNGRRIRNPQKTRAAPV